MSGRADLFFSITEALRIKLGYDSVEAMKENARDKFSLVGNGIFDRKCTTMLILNVSCFAGPSD